MKFQIETSYKPSGDQPKAIKALTEGVISGKKGQVLLGITGSGKTFTLANVIQNVQKPTLIIAHNKTLAAQLYQEFKEFFPHNAVEYFVSYYDYYQPEAYIARTDTYIEKDMAINDRIDKMRLSATRSLLEREDVIIVASVSCIYGLGSPEYYRGMNLEFECNATRRRDDILLHLVEMQYKRNDYDFSRGNFRVRGDLLEIFPAYEEDIALRVEMFDDDIERLTLFDPLTGKQIKRIENYTLYPSSHHVTPEEVRESAIQSIKEELVERTEIYENDSRLIEKQRIHERTMHDLEMIKEIGFCKGIENYSRHFSKRKKGEAPPCLIDYFPKDFLFIFDESHQTIPQIGAMRNGDRARKTSLIDFGFRLPSAFDNRPLSFDEAYQKIHQAIYVSATPAPWEKEESQGNIVEQIIRPTGLLDPIIEIRPATTQIDDALHEIREHTKKGGRVLVTTLTKKLAEELSNYLEELGIKAKYLHSDIVTLERTQIINDLRSGLFDVLVGINLLREGLDIPEVSLVTILDADKEGFLRSETSLTQTCGRAARNAEGRVIMYADKMTKSIQNTVNITQSRREIQKKYNLEHNITPQTIIRPIKPLLEEEKPSKEIEKLKTHLTEKQVEKQIKAFEKEMKQLAKDLKFEEASLLRDQIRALQNLEMDL
ncbi:excinuclease ABC subunit UvrB [Chlamydiales bacterium]|nr:excinuclease ABC subunit UvrB [Chlamydiales bacterium]